MAAFALGIEGIGGRTARSDQATRILSDIGAIGSDAPDQLQTHDVNRSRARGRLFVVNRRGIQEILKVDSQAVVHIHAQDHRSWSLVCSELNVTGDKPSCRV